MKFLAKVIPKSRREEVKFDGSVIKVWLHAAPEGGKANDELVRILAEKLSLSKKSVTIVSGFSSRNKAVDILGVTARDLARIFPTDGS